MMKGLAITAVCIGTLAAVDREMYGGQHIGRVLQMLREISFAFGF